MHLFAALIIPFLSFFLQSYPRFFNKFFGVDVWTRLIETDHVRKNQHRMPGKITKGFLIPGFFDYPPLFPLILSFIPKKSLMKLQGFVAPFFDALHCIVVFVITYELTGKIEIALVSQLIYMFTPLIALENSYLTPRSFGYLNFTLALYPILLYSVTPKFYYLIVAYFFITLIFLSHRFATQSFFFAVIFFSILDRTLLYFFTFIAGFITAMILTKGYYLKVLRGHLYNIYFWVINYKLRFSHPVYGTKESIKNKDLVGKIYYFLGTFSPATLIGTNIWILSAFVFMTLKVKNLNLIDIQNPMYYKLSIWIIFFYFFAILVLSVKRLIPIGEGQRYVEMASAPSAVMSSVLFFLFFNSPFKIPALVLLVLFLTVNLGLIIFIQIKGIIRNTTRSLTQNMQKAYKFINQLKKTPKIICIPHQITTMTIYNTKADVLVNADNKGLMEVMDFYPVLKKPVSEIAKKFGINYVLLREDFAKLKDLNIKNAKVVFKSENVSLIKIGTKI